MSSLLARIHELAAVLGEEVIDLDQLRQCCFNGIADEQAYRPVCWKLLLNYLPPDRSQWRQQLHHHRHMYRNFVEEMIVRPGASMADSKNEGVGGEDGGVACNGHTGSCQRVEVTHDDHPFNDQPDSQWATYFRDNEVLWQIDKDVRRLCPDISFFQQATEYPCRSVVSAATAGGGSSCTDRRLHRRVERCRLLSSQALKPRNFGVKTMVDLGGRRRRDPCELGSASSSPVHSGDDDYCPLSAGREAHWEVVERVLFVFAKLNPGLSYVQGMNEIVGPIYYCFATDPDLAAREHAEADTFGVFMRLMAEIRDFFIKTLDNSQCGINHVLSSLMSTLRRHDPALVERLHLLGLKPQYFAFRWITVMLTHEFRLPDVMRIWDSLFSDPLRFNFLMDFCCAMMILVRDQLMTADFAGGMKLLQRYPAMDISIIINKAKQLNASGR